jgi:hypothetical protein
MSRLPVPMICIAAMVKTLGWLVRNSTFPTGSMMYSAKRNDIASLDQRKISWKKVLATVPRDVEDGDFLSIV